MSTVLVVVTSVAYVLCVYGGYRWCKFRVRRGASGAVAQAAGDATRNQRESLVAVVLYASGNDLDPPDAAIYMTKEAERLWNQIVLTTLVRSVNSLGRFVPGEDPQ